MGKITSDKFFGKIYFDKSEEELHQIIEEKLALIAKGVSWQIIQNWRNTCEADPYDPNASRIGEHDLITIIEFLGNYSSEDWAEVFLLKFVQYINEIKNTGGWTQMFRGWETDERKSDPRITTRRQEDGNLLFKDRQDRDQWFANKQKQHLITDALGDRGIGNDPGSTQNKYFILPNKKRNGVGHA